jgi:hypothetical protein
LRGFGPVGESPLGPVLTELTTDRSDASGTGYWSPITGNYDLDPFDRALGHTPNLPDSTASLFGLTLASTTRPNLARAAIEGLLCWLADGLDAVKARGVVVVRILLIGGVAQNPALRTIAAQLFECPVVVPAPGEYVAAGAAVRATGPSQVTGPCGRSASLPRHSPTSTRSSGHSTPPTAFSLSLSLFRSSRGKLTISTRMIHRRSGEIPANVT